MGLLGALFGVKDSAEYLKIIQNVSAHGGKGIAQVKFTGFAAFIMANMEVVERTADSITATKDIDGKRLFLSVDREMKAGGADTGRSIVTVIAEK